MSRMERKEIRRLRGALKVIADGFAEVYGVDPAIASRDELLSVYESSRKYAEAVRQPLYTLREFGGGWEDERAHP
jgi:hypothetical protein